jgi:hypothetical protein
MSLCTTLQTVACAHRPPADFAPDPGLLGQIREIQIIADSKACPGATILATYEAVLADGSRVRFARSYDAKHPPRLHVVLLDRESPEAVSREDGGWTAERDPLQTVSTGFRLTATLRAKPSVTGTVVVPPDYGCMNHRFAFSAAPGGLAGLKGGDGPDVTIRLAMVRSPFHDRLYVAAIEVGGARTFYVLGDASAVAPADWLIVESQGGAGGAGLPGTDGMDGAPGSPGCPGQPGFPGWSGSAGGAGGTGGSGGRFTVIVPEDQQFLAKLVDGLSWGGSGGPGGSGGRGGRGGKGGLGLFDTNNQLCANGSDGASGGDGIAGQSGSQGASWPGSVVVTAPTKNLFGGQVPPGLAELLKGVPRGR